MNGTEYRLTDDDEATMRLAIRRRYAALLVYPSGLSVSSDLRIVAARAIGCTLDDLRDVEVQWIDNEIGELALGLTD